MISGSKMYTFLIVIAALAVIYLTDQFFLWFERKNWIYYRHKKAPSSTAGNALQDLHVMLNPSTRHTIEMKQNKIQLGRKKSSVASKDI